MGRKQVVAGAVSRGENWDSDRPCGGGCCPSSWHISAYQTRSAYDADRRAQEYAEGASNRVESACIDAESADVVECLAEQVAATREDQRSEYDLSAQNRMAQWAFWTMVAGVLTTGLTAVALWFIRGTLKATREAVEDTSNATNAMLAANVIAKAAAEAAVTQAEVAKEAQRPWVQLTLTDLKLEVYDPEFRAGGGYDRYQKHRTAAYEDRMDAPKSGSAFVRNSNEGVGWISRDLVASVETYPEGDRWGAHLPGLSGGPGYARRLVRDHAAALWRPRGACSAGFLHPHRRKRTLCHSRR
ncbi:MAG: hypothetical protein KL785_03830 [Brevundimonas sp.]|nr:hypothetical protein [Brevundimonas sp.]